MANIVNELGNPKVIAANGTANVAVGGALIGFLPSVGGTITITDKDGTSMFAGTTVSAGTWTPLACACPNGAIVTLSGGAAGTLLVG